MKSFIFHNEDDKSFSFINGRAFADEKESDVSVLWTSLKNNQSSGDSIGINKPTRSNYRYISVHLPTEEKINHSDGALSKINNRNEIENIDVHFESTSRMFKDENEINFINRIRKNNTVNDIVPHLLSSAKKFSVLNNVRKMETIHEDELFSPFAIISQNSRLNPKTTFFVNFGGKIWKINLLNDDCKKKQVILEALDKMHEPTNNVWLATIGDSEGLSKALSKRWPFKGDFKEVDHLNRTLLHLAVESGSTDAVRLLLESGLFNPNAVDGMEHTPLFYATLKRPSLPIARLLFQYGAVIPPRKTSTDIGLFLEFVIMSKPTPVEEQIMELLIENGAQLEDADAPGGRQGLHYAAMSNNTELIRTLINLGADLNVVNHLGMTPMDVAVFYLCRDAQFCLEDIGISRILVDLGMNRRDF